MHAEQTHKMAGHYQLKRKSSICIRIEEERGDVHSASRSSSAGADALRKVMGEVDEERPTDEPKQGTLEQLQENTAGQDDDTDIISDTDTIQLEVCISYCQEKHVDKIILLANKAQASS